MQLNTFKTHFLVIAMTVATNISRSNDRAIPIFLILTNNLSDNSIAHAQLHARRKIRSIGHAVFFTKSR